MSKDDRDPKIQMGQVGWSPDYRGPKPRELPGQLRLPFAGPHGAPPPSSPDPQTPSPSSSSSPRSSTTMQILAWKKVALGGPVGVRIQHRLGHTNYQPLVTVLGAPAEVGDLSFDIQKDHCTLFNSGVSHGKMAMVSFVFLEPTKEAR